MKVNVSPAKSFECLQCFRVVPEHSKDFLVCFHRFAGEVFEDIEFGSFSAARNVGYAVDSFVHEFFFVEGEDVAKSAVRDAVLS